MSNEPILFDGTHQDREGVLRETGVPVDLNDPPPLSPTERGNCARKGCGRPYSEHDYGTFCP